MAKWKVLRAGVFGAAFFVSAAGAGWELYSESGQITFYDLDFDGRPVGYLAGLENWLADDG
jgi:hypothetical protein